MAFDLNNLLSTPSEYATPQQIEALRAYSTALMQPKQQQTLYKPWQALTGALQQALGGYYGHRADVMQQEMINRANLSGTPGLGNISPAPAAPAPASPSLGGQISGAVGDAGDYVKSLFGSGSANAGAASGAGGAGSAIAAPYKASEADLDRATRTVLGEADPDPQSQKAVAAVIANRARSGGIYGNDIPTITRPSQFEAWARNPDKLNAIDPASPSYKQARAQVESAFNGDDPTGGATHFYAPKLQADLGRQPPSWASAFESKGTFGTQDFFRDPKNAPPVSGQGAAAAAGLPDQATSVRAQTFSPDGTQTGGPGIPGRTASLNTGTATDASPAASPSSTHPASGQGTPIPMPPGLRGVTATTAEPFQGPQYPAPAATRPPSFAQSQVAALMGSQNAAQNQPAPGQDGVAAPSPNPALQAQIRALGAGTPAGAPSAPQPTMGTPVAPMPATAQHAPVQAGQAGQSSGLQLPPGVNVVDPLAQTGLSVAQVRDALNNQFTPPETKKALEQMMWQRKQPQAVPTEEGTYTYIPETGKVISFIPKIGQETMKLAGGGEFPSNFIWQRDAAVPGGYRKVYLGGQGAQGQQTPGAPQTDEFPANGSVQDKITWAQKNESRLAATKKASEKAGEVEGEVNQQAEAALQVKSTTSEMRNLVQNFKPGALAEAKVWVGNLATSLGVPQDKVNETLGKTGDIEAFKKNTAFLAIEAVKQISNRATQMEFMRFLENNPNIFMTPQGMQRVLDRIEKVADMSLDRQKSWTEYKNATSADKWGDFNTHWTQLQRQKVDQGYYNSKPEPTSPEGGPAKQVATPPEVGESRRGWKFKVATHHSCDRADWKWVGYPAGQEGK